MADPQHEPDLDDFDRATVRLYRIGLTLSACMTVLVGLAYLGAVTDGAIGNDLVRDWIRLGWIGLVYATAVASIDVHLYAKQIKWTIQAAAWFGAVLMLTSTELGRPAVAWWTWHVGLGFVFVAQSGFALKERYCFKLPLLYLVPVCLAGSLIPLAMDWWLPAGILVTASGLLLGVLAFAKDRMPLHYDIGDKSRYQV